MIEPEFENYLLADENIKSKEKAVRSRIAKARLIERHFDIALDEIVNDDDKTYQFLLRIKAELKDANGTVSNALRKYYIFKNGKSFPSLSEFGSLKR
jgi:hypothetical protein